MATINVNLDHLDRLLFAARKQLKTMPPRSPRWQRLSNPISSMEVRIKHQLIVDFPPQDIVALRQPTPEKVAKEAMCEAERGARAAGGTIRYAVTLKLPDGCEVTREVETKRLSGAGQKAIGVANKECGLKQHDVRVLKVELAAEKGKR